MSNKKYTPPKVEFFNFWDAGCIGLNITDSDDNLTLTADFTLDDAKAIHQKLGAAIAEFEEIDKDCNEYFEREKAKETK